MAESAIARATALAQQNPTDGVAYTALRDLPAGAAPTEHRMTVASIADSQAAMFAPQRPCLSTRVKWGLLSGTTFVLAIGFGLLTTYLGKREHQDQIDQLQDLGALAGTLGSAGTGAYAAYKAIFNR
jgi:hypothetical protein